MGANWNQELLLKESLGGSALNACLNIIGAGTLRNIFDFRTNRLADFCQEDRKPGS